MRQRHRFASRRATSRVAARADVVVVGGGPAGMAAAIAAARNGARRHAARALQPPRRPRLGRHGAGARRHVGQPPARDLGARHLHELIERLAAREPRGVSAPARMGRRCPATLQRWTRWGTFDFHSQDKPHPIVLRRRLRSRRLEARRRSRWSRSIGIELRLHSWFSRALVEDGRIKGVVCETKSGREAILGDVVIDATGDLDVAASAGAPHIGGAYIMTTVFRLGGVDTDAAERFEREEPERFAAHRPGDQAAASAARWAHWWLKTPLPGVVWCNCPHMAGPRRPQGRGPDARPRCEGRGHIHAAGRLRARQPAGLRALLSWSTSRRRPACARPACSKASTW